MTYKINILKNADKGLDWFRKKDRENYLMETGKADKQNFYLIN